MKYTKSQKMMIEDGLPVKCIMDKKQRDQAWKDHPPTKAFAPIFEKNINMTQEEIILLLELKESKERGAASLGCSHHRLAPIAQLERLGFAKQHGYGPTSFYITDAGLKEAGKYDKMYEERKKMAAEKPAPVIPPSRWAAESAKAYKISKEPKVQKAKPASKVNPNLSAICKECGVTSNNRTKALDFLFSKIGKMQTHASVMKAIYGSGGTPGAADIVIKSIQRDLGNGGASGKYELKRDKDVKGVYTYGLYKK